MLSMKYKFSSDNFNLAVFYYILGNIRPVFRSTLQAMQIVAVARADDVHTYGYNNLLKPFVEQMKLLAQVCNTES